MKIREDILTPKERNKAFSEGKPIDRIVCTPMLASSAVYLIGKKIKEFQLNPEVMAESHITAYKRFRYDSVGLCTHCAIIAEAMGAKLTYLEDDVARCDEPILKSKDDLDKIKISTEKDGKLWVLYEAAQIVNKEIGDEVSPSISTPGAFTTAATLRGVENFARDLYKDPEFCHKLLRMTTESAKNHIRAVAASGAAIGGIAEPIASGNLIGPKIFEEFVSPYIKELVEFMKTFNTSAGLHICGNVNKLIEPMIATGVSTLSVDRIDLQVLKEKVAGRTKILGNIDPTQEMLYGPVEKIHEACKRAIDIMKGYEGGYILSTGCDISPKAPFEYVQAMMDAARSYGAYEYIRQ